MPNLVALSQYVRSKKVNPSSPRTPSTMGARNLIKSSLCLPSSLCLLQILAYPADKNSDGRIDGWTTGKRNTRFRAIERRRPKTVNGHFR